MSTPQEDTLNMNLKLLTFAMAVIVSIFGFFIVRTLNSIDQNIAELKTELQKKSEVVSNHETRIQILEKFNLNKTEK